MLTIFILGVMISVIHTVLIKYGSTFFIDGGLTLLQAYLLSKVTYFFNCFSTTEKVLKILGKKPSFNDIYINVIIISALLGIELAIILMIFPN